MTDDEHQPEPGTVHTNSPPILKSDSSAARGLTIHSSGTGDYWIVFAVGWLAAAAANGVIGNITYDALKHVFQRSRTRIGLHGNPNTGWRQFFGARRRSIRVSKLNAEIIAGFALQARCAELGFAVPRTADMKIVETRACATNPDNGVFPGYLLWHVIIHADELRAEVVLGDGLSETIPISIWTVSSDE